MFLETLGTTDPIAHIDYTADQGFAGIEDNWAANRPEAEQARIGQALADRGLEMGCFVAGCDPTDKAWVSDDDASRASVDARVAGAIEISKRLNGRYLTLAIAGNPAVPASYQSANVLRHLRRIAAMCERAKVMICIEPTNREGLPGMLLQHVSDAYALVKAADSPAVKLLFDMYHVQLMDGDLVSNFQRCLDEIAIIQIADVPGRRELGLGEIHWANVLRSVRDSGYRGLIEYEVVPSRPGKEGEAAAVDALRRIDAAVGQADGS